MTNSLLFQQRISPQPTMNFLFTKVCLLLFCISLTSVNAVNAADMKAVLVVRELFKLAGITDGDPGKCVKDSTGADKHLKDFSTDITNKDYDGALRDLNLALSSMSTSINDCKVDELKTKLDALAASIKFGKITVVDEAIEIIVDATDLSALLTQLAIDIEGGDAATIAADIQKIFDFWSSIEKECNSDACKFIDGILRVFQITAEDISGECSVEIQKSYDDISSSLKEFESKDYKNSFTHLAAGLDELAVALNTDVCQITKLAAAIAKVSPKLSNVIIDGDKIMIAYANVYDDVYKLVEAVKAGDLATIGLELGNLIKVIQASNCQSNACKILIGVMQSLELAAEDFEKCAASVDKTGTDFEAAIAKFEAEDFKGGLDGLAVSVLDLSADVKDCDIQKLGDVLEQLANDLGANSVANVIDEVVVLLVSGADITDDINDSITDFKSGNFVNFGKDLGDIASILQDKLHCNSRVCKLVEGLLIDADVVFSHLKSCEADLKLIDDDVTKAFAELKDKDYTNGVKDFSAALRALKKALSTDDCGLGDTFAWMDHDANTFSLSTGTNIAVHGMEFVEEIEAFVSDFENHDYRAAGGDLNEILKNINNWAEDHSCEKVSCYIVEGIMEAEEILEGSIKECESDFEMAWGNFSAAVEVFTKSTTEAQMMAVSDKYGLDDEDVEVLQEKLTKEIEEAIRDIGHGLEDVSKGVSACHLDELADLLARLAAELAIPEVSWIKEVLHVLVHGAEISDEIGEACVDFGDENYVRFGFDLAKLIKTLL